MVRGALSALLALEHGHRGAGGCADGTSAWTALQRLRPDVIVADIEMPGLTGPRARRARCATRPSRAESSSSRPSPAPGTCSRALDAGVAGYLLKDAPAQQLADAVRRVHAGGRVVDPQLAVEAWSEADPLNERERQVLRLAGEGLSSADIAAQLSLSHGTVRNYLSEAIGKLNASNRIEAYRLARQKGWL